MPEMSRVGRPRRGSCGSELCSRPRDRAADGRDRSSLPHVPAVGGDGPKWGGWAAFTRSSAGRTSAGVGQSSQRGEAATKTERQQDSTTEKRWPRRSRRTRRRTNKEPRKPGGSATAGASIRGGGIPSGNPTRKLRFPPRRFLGSGKRSVRGGPSHAQPVTLQPLTRTAA